MPRYPGGLIYSIKLKFPKVVSKLINLLGKRLLRLQQPSLSSQSQGIKDVGQETSAANLQGYSMVIAVTPGVPLQNITAELVYSLSEVGTAICITPEVVKNSLGANALDPSNDFKVTGWLGAQEDHFDTVIYQVEEQMIISA